jgi:serpin B
MRAATFLLSMVLASNATGMGCPKASGGGCNLPCPARSAMAEPAVGRAAVVEAGTRFAFDLYGELAAERGNLFFSPYSVSAALSMTYAGAGGVTAEEMARVLHIEGDSGRWHEAVGSFQAELGRSGDGYALSIANRLWGQRDYEFSRSFLDVTREHYGAELSQLDFSAPEQARVTINDWVAGQTQQKIQELLAQGTIEDSTRLVLTNAVYFKGTWLAQFDPERTTDAPFYPEAERPVTVSMMHHKGRFAYGELDDLKVLEIPYSGNEITMVLLLPREADGLVALEQKLTHESFNDWIGSLHELEVQVALPRFTVSASLDLGSLLPRMGMASAFDPRSADFSGMTGRRDLFISAAVHEAYVEVNEEGTEAAAATGIVMGLTSARPGPSFIADHPFLFLIRDRATDAVLFLGRLQDPSA